MTPPFPSPPITAASRKMARATCTSPTGVRTRSAPHSRAASSTTRLVDRLQTTDGRTAGRADGDCLLRPPVPPSAGPPSTALTAQASVSSRPIGVALPRAAVRRALRRPPPASRVLPRQLVHAGAIRPVQENPTGPDELRGIPVDRVVARRHRDPAAACMALDGKLDRRGRHQTDFD